MARQAARGSWFSALLGLSFLAVLAFFVGALAGLVWKEPGLLIAYFQGDTTEIAWRTASEEVVPAELPSAVALAPATPAPGPVASVPKVPAAPKPAPVATAPTPKPAPVATAPTPKPAPVATAPTPKPAPVATAPTPKPAPVAAAPAPKKPPPDVASAPPGAHIAVQVGAFAGRDGAEALRQRLRRAGFPAYLTAGAREGDHWRVRVGPYASRDEAELVALRLERGEKLPTWVLDEDAE